MVRYKLFVFGPPRIEIDEVSLTVNRRKAIALLAYLAITNQPASRDGLATLFWPNYDRRRSRNALRSALAALNRTPIGACLAIEHETLALQPKAGLWVDVTHFRQLLATCRRHGHPPRDVCPECLVVLTEALALYQADFMAGFTLPDCFDFDAWQRIETEALRQDFAFTLGGLARLYSAQGNPEMAIPFVQRRLAHEPLDEPAHRQLMRLYVQIGQPAAALRQYQLCCDTLTTELGVSPASETISLYDDIRSGRRGFVGTTGSTPQPSSSSSPGHNLPAATTRFVGREMELDELSNLLAAPEVRLVTIVGVGGVGKTSLALAVAEKHLDHFEHGVYFVPLAALDSSVAIVPAIAEALHFTFLEGGPAEQQLYDYLRQKQVLLVLDNFEHLAEGAALVIEMLKEAAGVKVLTTSRVKLNVQGEQIYLLHGMSFPNRVYLETATSFSMEKHYDAVSLFLQTARRDRPNFAPRDKEMVAIARISQLVRGLPLGIILAAGWIGIMQPPEIVDEIERSLDFLATDGGTVSPRHRSIELVFEQSWRLLTEQEQAVFQQLAIFRGGCTREAAQAVTGASLPTLLALVNKSFLYRTSQGRFEIHELLRQFGAARLDQSAAGSEAARERHCAYFTALLKHWEANLKGHKQRWILAEMEADHENALAAWHWASEKGQIERLEQALDCLGLFYMWRGRFQQGENICQQAAAYLARLESRVNQRVLAKVLVWRSRFNWNLGFSDLADQYLEQSLTLLISSTLAETDTRPERAAALLQLGQSAFGVDDYEQARRHYEQSLELYRVLENQWGQAETLDQLGLLAKNLAADFDAAQQCYQASLTIRQSLGDQRGMANALMGLGTTKLYQGQLEESKDLIQQSVAIYDEIDDQANVAYGLFNLGRAYFWCDQLAKSEALQLRSLVTYSDLGLRRDLARAQTTFGSLKMHMGQYDQARQMIEQSRFLAQETGYELVIHFADAQLGAIALAEGAYEEARQLLQQSVAYFRGRRRQNQLGMFVATLGFAAYSLGNLSEAHQCLVEGLELIHETRAFGSILYALRLAAVLLAYEGEPEHAVELYAMKPGPSTSRWYEDVAGRHIATASATLPPAVVAAAQKRGRERDVWQTVTELLAKFRQA